MDLSIVIPFESNGFLARTELLVNAMRMGYQMAEYPTVLHSRVFGESKAKLARTIQAHLNFQVHVLMPWQPYGTVIKGSTEATYLYSNGQKRLFPSAEIFLSHGYHWQQVVQVNDNYLASLPDGPPIPFRDGTLLKSTANPIYVIEHGRKRHILSPEIFESLGYRWKDVITVPDHILNEIKSGPALAGIDQHPDGTLVKSSDEHIYLLEAGKKRWFSSPQVFLSWGYKWGRVITLSDERLAAYPSGVPIPAQESFYLKDIQEAIKVNVRPDELPNESLLAKLPQLIDGISNKIHLRDWPVVDKGIKIFSSCWLTFSDDFTMRG